MEHQSAIDAVAAATHRINQLWLTGHVDDLAPLVHAQVVMAVPGFGARIQGREQFLAGFRDFCDNAKIEEFRESDEQVDLAGNTAIVTFRFEMIYERASERYRTTGRDFWVFQNQDSKWLAVWRTMLDMEEEPA
ncbi:MAG TPA: nuclear transport factor 2 family protein [Bryobacteraceae bacterium]|jgi:ketosteroid isomerase-like protein